MRLRAYLRLQTRNEISDEKKDPQLPPSLTAVSWLNTQTWDPETWLLIWASNHSLAVWSWTRFINSLYLNFCIYKMGWMRVITEGLNEFKTCKMLNTVSNGDLYTYKCIIILATTNICKNHIIPSWWVEHKEKSMGYHYKLYPLVNS